MKLPVINTILLVSILSYLVISSIGGSANSNQAYVVTGELFNEFEYQKEMDAEFTAIKESKLQELEEINKSLAVLELQARSEKATSEDIAKFQNGFNQYKQIEYNIQQELTELNNQYSVQIWNKLNSFVNMYGSENEFEIIFGAVGNGNVMYAQEQKNITQDLIAYCNAKYNGQ